MPNCFQKVPKWYPHQFLHNSNLFKFALMSPICLGLLLIADLLPRTLKNRPSYSHWLHQMHTIVSSLKGPWGTKVKNKRANVGWTKNWSNEMFLFLHFWELKFSSKINFDQLKRRKNLNKCQINFLSFLARKFYNFYINEPFGENSKFLSLASKI